MTQQQNRPTQDKPLWEYAAGGLLWGFGFFGAALILKKAFDPSVRTELREYMAGDDEDQDEED